MQKENGTAGRLFPFSQSQWFFKQQFIQKNLNWTSSMSIFNLGNPGSTVCGEAFCSIPVFKQEENWARQYGFRSQVKSEGLLDWISICNYFFWGVVWSLQVSYQMNCVLLNGIQDILISNSCIPFSVASVLFYVFSAFLSLSPSNSRFLEHFE